VIIGPHAKLCQIQLRTPQIPANQNLSVEIRVTNPTTGAPMKYFQIVHEKPIHLFIVS
jgi:hypothetical protein